MSSWLLVAIGFVILLGVIVLVRLAPALFAGTVDREIMAMPMSPLQKRAWWVLAISSATLVLLLLVLSLGGMQDYYQDRELRWSLMAIFLVGLVASSAVLYLPMVGSDSSMDERDLLIMTKGSQIQSVTIALWLVFWAIWTTETYWEQGAIPIAFPILIAMSSIIVNLAGLSLGILICYRTMARHG